jgi:hypothetical protein
MMYFSVMMPRTTYRTVTAPAKPAVLLLVLVTLQLLTPVHSLLGSDPGSPHHDGFVPVMAAGGFDACDTDVHCTSPRTGESDCFCCSPCAEDRGTDEAADSDAACGSDTDGCCDTDGRCDTEGSCDSGGCNDCCRHIPIQSAVHAGGIDLFFPMSSACFASTQALLPGTSPDLFLPPRS